MGKLHMQVNFQSENYFLLLSSFFLPPFSSSPPWFELIVASCAPTPPSAHFCQTWLKHWSTEITSLFGFCYVCISLGFFCCWFLFVCLFCKIAAFLSRSFPQRNCTSLPKPAYQKPEKSTIIEKTHIPISISFPFNTFSILKWLI